MQQPEPFQRLHAIVHGRVQGVNFRVFAAHRARELSLTGWVKNLVDGTVETVAVGDEAALDKFLAALQEGPSSALVTRVESSMSPTHKVFDTFEIMR